MITPSVALPGQRIHTLRVAGLGGFGYLADGSDAPYGNLGATTADILAIFASAIFDNMPMMFAVPR